MQEGEKAIVFVVHFEEDPYGYHTNPIVFIDPDGNWFLIDDAIAIVGGAIVGGITAAASGNDIWAGMAIGAAIGEASLYTAGAAAALVGGGVGGAAIGGAVGGVMSSALNTGMLSGAGIGNGWSNITAQQIGMAAMGGAIGGVSSMAGGAISDRLVAAGDLGKWASIGTEIGVSAVMGAGADASVQGISIAAGWQSEFSVARMGTAAGSAAGMAGVRIASRGYLRNSTSAAEGYFAKNDAAKARYMKHISEDPTKVRIAGYREGGYFKPRSRQGMYWGGNHGISNYAKDKYTFVHEASHKYIRTYDNGATMNAYSFESWVWDSPHTHYDLSGVGWKNGIPNGGAYKDYTIW